MATPTQTTSGGTAPNSSRSARAKLEEALGKLGITDEEATPLVTDDADEVPSCNPRHDASCHVASCWSLVLTPIDAYMPMHVVLAAREHHEFIHVHEA